MSRWLLLAGFLTAILVGLTTMPQRSRAQETLWVVSVFHADEGWRPYRGPKGRDAQPQGREVCMLDLASARNAEPGKKLECRRFR